MGGQWVEGWALRVFSFFIVVDLNTGELEMSCSNGFHTYLQWSFFNRKLQALNTELSKWCCFCRGR